MSWDSQPRGAPTAEAGGAGALEWTALLASEVGGRRPTSRAEHLAAELIGEGMRERGVAAALEPFAGYPTFAQPYGVILALACAPALVPRRLTAVRAALAGLGAALLASEGGLVRTPLSDLLSRRESRNVVATIEPRSPARRTLCLIAHLDTSRSGMLFDPRLAGVMQRWITLQSLAVLASAGEALLARRGTGRALLAGARAICATGLSLLAERELRGVDVPGANDNASGVGVVAELGAEIAERPLDATRVVVLVAGCEEAGLLGTRAFLRAHDTRDWLFVNFDGVGAPATLRYLPDEGVLRRWPADPALLRCAARIERERPELGLREADAPIGLTYDATAVLAAGGRALTLAAGDRGRIPNYHQPTDTVENLDPEALERALAVGRELVAAIDRGEAD